MRLLVEGMEEQGEDGVAWAWSIGTAMLEGARRHFELDDDDLDVIVQTARSADGRNRALEILWVETYDPFETRARNPVTDFNYLLFK